MASNPTQSASFDNTAEGWAITLLSTALQIGIAPETEVLALFDSLASDEPLSRDVLDRWTQIYKRIIRTDDGRGLTTTATLFQNALQTLRQTWQEDTALLLTPYVHEFSPDRITAVDQKLFTMYPNLSSAALKLRGRIGEIYPSLDNSVVKEYLDALIKELYDYANRRAETTTQNRRRLHQIHLTLTMFEVILVFRLAEQRDDKQRKNFEDFRRSLLLSIEYALPWTTDEEHATLILDRAAILQNDGWANRLMREKLLETWIINERIRMRLIANVDQTFTARPASENEVIEDGTVEEEIRKRLEVHPPQIVMREILHMGQPGHVVDRALLSAAYSYRLKETPQVYEAFLPHMIFPMEQRDAEMNDAGMLTISSNLEDVVSSAEVKNAPLYVFLGGFGKLPYRKGLYQDATQEAELLALNTAATTQDSAHNDLNFTYMSGSAGEAAFMSALMPYADRTFILAPPRNKLLPLFLSALLFTKPGGYIDIYTPAEDELPAWLPKITELVEASHTSRVTSLKTRDTSGFMRSREMRMTRVHIPFSSPLNPDKKKFRFKPGPVSVRMNLATDYSFSPEDEVSKTPGNAIRNLRRQQKVNRQRTTRGQVRPMVMGRTTPLMLMGR